ncbi:MAG: helix-turn-helix transcriptional regulator [Firmicutes bacterium]|nr:helix-turn-helix transcriptional regulator [Candidatus Fiminaster equi]
MGNLNQIFADNLIKLRKSKKLTQLELSEKLNYSDRNISKWENGSSLPTCDTLRELSIFFGVSMDYFFEEHAEVESSNDEKESKRLKLLIIGLAMLGALFASVVCFIAFPNSFHYSWLSFVWGVVICSIIGIVFCAIWFSKSKFLFISISAFIWTTFASSYLTVLVTSGSNLWFIFFVCIPLQLAVIVWSRMPIYRKQN